MTNRKLLVVSLFLAACGRVGEGDPSPIVDSGTAVDAGEPEEKPPTAYTNYKIVFNREQLVMQLEDRTFHSLSFDLSQNPANLSRGPSQFKSPFYPGLDYGQYVANGFFRDGGEACSTALEASRTAVLETAKYPKDAIYLGKIRLNFVSSLSVDGNGYMKLCYATHSKKKGWRWNYTPPVFTFVRNSTDSRDPNDLSIFTMDLTVNEAGVDQIVFNGTRVDALVDTIDYEAVPYP